MRKGLVHTYRRRRRRHFDRLDKDRTGTVGTGTVGTGTDHIHSPGMAHQAGERQAKDIEALWAREWQRKPLVHQRVVLLSACWLGMVTSPTSEGWPPCMPRSRVEVAMYSFQKE